MFKHQLALLITVLACSSLLAQPPVRTFDDPGAPPFEVLKESENPPLDANDHFVVGPKYVRAPERKKVDGVPEGNVMQFVIDSKETKLFNPGIARNKFGTVDPNNPKTLVVETHNIDYKRKITVYIPSQYKAGSESPFQVIHDGPGGRPNAELLHIGQVVVAARSRSRRAGR
jgi:iron(III)-enterobactin esterase